MDPSENGQAIKVLDVWSDCVADSYERAAAIYLRGDDVKGAAVVLCESGRSADVFRRFADDLDLSLSRVTLWQGCGEQLRGASLAGATFIMEKPSSWKFGAQQADFLNAATELRIIIPRPFDRSFGGGVALAERETRMLNAGVLPSE